MRKPKKETKVVGNEAKKKKGTKENNVRGRKGYLACAEVDED